MRKIDIKAVVPIILTGIGVLGTLVTVGNCQRDTVKAMQHLNEMAEKPKDKKEEFKECWTYYLPTIISGSVTIVSITAAGYLSHKTEMALAAALALNRDNLKKFEKKAKEIVGEDKIKEIKTEVAKDSAETKKPPRKDPVSGCVRIYEPYTEQYIDTSIDKLSLAKLYLNEELAIKGETGYNRFLTLIGGKTSKNWDSLGWSFSNDIQDYNWSYQEGYWLQIYTSEMNVDGQDILVVCFNVGPEIQEYGIS